MKYFLELKTADTKQRDHLFGRIHGFLRSHHVTDTAVSFPDFTPKFYGLRLFIAGPRDKLEAMLKNPCLQGEQVSGISVLDRQLELFARCQSLANKSNARLTKKIAKNIVHFQKKGYRIDTQLIAKKICSAAQEYSSNHSDYIEVTSAGSGRTFSIRIKKVDFEPLYYSSYGLAKEQRAN